jgi:hypothetical protein
MSPSGGYWRCAITAASNISTLNGALMVSDDDSLVARYSSADRRKYFGWIDASHVSPSSLAELFVARFPGITNEGRGSDWQYAGWYVDMLSKTYPNAFPIAYADWELPRGKLTTVGGKEVDVPLPPPGYAAKETGLYGPHESPLHFS